MICKCGAKLIVVNTRLHKCGTMTRRQYKCPDCGKHTITFELEQRALQKLEQFDLRKRLSEALLKVIAETP